jgi:hypothetical protein
MDRRVPDEALTVSGNVSVRFFFPCNIYPRPSHTSPSRKKASIRIKFQEWDINITEQLCVISWRDCSREDVKILFCRKA